MHSFGEDVVHLRHARPCSGSRGRGRERDGGAAFVELNQCGGLTADKYSRPPFPVGASLQSPRWVPEATATAMATRTVFLPPHARLVSQAQGDSDHEHW